MAKKSYAILSGLKRVGLTFAEATMPDIVDFTRAVGSGVNSLSSSINSMNRRTRVESAKRSNIYVDNSFKKLKDDINSGNIFSGKDNTAIGEFMDDYSGEAKSNEFDSAKGTANAITGSAEYLSKAFSESSNALLVNITYMHNETMHSINNIQKIQEEQLKFSLGTLTKFIGITAEYYDESIKIMSSIDEKIGKLSSSIDSRFGAKTDSSKNEPLIDERGHLNFKAYFKIIGSKTLASTRMGKGIGLIKGLLTDPVGTIMSEISKGADNAYGGAFRKINDSFLGGFNKLLDKMDLLKNSDNPIAKGIGNLLSIDNHSAKNPSMAGYKNQAITLEVENKKVKAITEVIPQYLSAIYAAVSPDHKEMIFNYDSGQFIDKASAGMMINQKLMNIKTSGYNNTRSAFTSAYAKIFSKNKLTEEETEVLNSDTERFFAFMTDNDISIDDALKMNYKELEDRGINLLGKQKSLNYIKKAYKNNSKLIGRYFSTDRRTSRFNSQAKYNSAMNSLNYSGLSSMMNGFNGKNEYLKYSDYLLNGNELKYRDFAKRNKRYGKTGLKKDGFVETTEDKISNEFVKGIMDVFNMKKTKETVEKGESFLDNIVDRISQILAIELGADPDKMSTAEKVLGKFKITAGVRDAFTEIRTGKDPKIRDAKINRSEDPLEDENPSTKAATGGIITKSGLVRLAEQGRELLITKYGSMIISKATNMILHEGDRVVPLNDAKIDREAVDEDSEDGEEGIMGLIKDKIKNSRIGRMASRVRRVGSKVVDVAKNSAAKIKNSQKLKNAMKKIFRSSKSGNTDTALGVVEDATNNGSVEEAAALSTIANNNNNLQTSSKLKKGGSGFISSLLSKISPYLPVIAAVASAILGLIGLKLLLPDKQTEKFNSDTETYRNSDVTSGYLEGNVSKAEYMKSKNEYIRRAKEYQNIQASGARGLLARGYSGLLRRFGRGVDKDYYSQRDPKWSNVAYGKYNGTTDTIGAGGCGPSVAAMMFQRLTGQTITPKDAAMIALENGYKENGTSTELFTKYGSMYGYNIGVNDGLSQDALIALKSGIPVAFIGKSNDGKAPFGFGSHYVLGIGSDGKNIDIYDPMDQRNNKKYSRDELSSSISTSIVPSSVAKEGSGKRGRGSVTIPLNLASKALINKKSNKASNDVLSAMKRNIDSAARGGDDTMIKLVDSILAAVININDNITTLTRVTMTANQSYSSYSTSESMSSAEDSDYKLNNYNKAIMA